MIEPGQQLSVSVRRSPDGESWSLTAAVGRPGLDFARLVNRSAVEVDDDVARGLLAYVQTVYPGDDVPVQS